jgi:hypothetical protein
MFKPFFMKAKEKPTNKEVQPKVKKEQNNYYAGRVGFRGSPSAYVKTGKSLAKIQFEMPTWKWEVITKEAYDSWCLLQL